MISMSNISSTGTLHGIIYRGVGGASSYSELTNKPKINNVTIDGDKTGHDYNLANLSDIPVVPPSPPSYSMNVHHDDYYTDDLNWIMSNNIQKQWKVYSQPFGHCTAGSAGSRGLVPQPQAGWEDKILCAGSGWIDPPAGLKDYSTSEVDTGQKWIDGKTIYQKSYTSFSGTSGSSRTLDLGLSGIDKIWIVNEGSLLSSDSSIFPFPYVHPSSFNVIGGYIYNANNSPKFEFRTGGDSKDVIIEVLTVRYTKV